MFLAFKSKILTSSFYVGIEQPIERKNSRILICVQVYKYMKAIQRIKSNENAIYGYKFNF